MKKLLCTLALVAVAAGSTFAAERNLGVGFILGNPSGLSVQIPMGPANAMDLLIGYNLDRDLDPPNRGVLYLGTDYVWYNYNVFPVPRGRLPLYYGPGIKATVSNNSTLGIRGVLGLDYQFANAPFDIFLEIGPGINVMPNTDPDVSGGFGARFFF